MSTPEEPIVVSSVTVVQYPFELTVASSDFELELNAPGPQGPRGPAGQAGAPGGSAYEHVQSVAASVWNVVHGLGRRSHATILDADGVEIETDVQHASINEIVVQFPTPQTGTVIVS